MYALDPNQPGNKVLEMLEKSKHVLCGQEPLYKGGGRFQRFLFLHPSVPFRQEPLALHAGELLRYEPQGEVRC